MLQAAPPPGATVRPLEYACVDNIGRLPYGHQPDPANFSSVAWTTMSGNEAFSGLPTLAQNADGRLHMAWRKLAGPHLAGTPVATALANGAATIVASDDTGTLQTATYQSPGATLSAWTSLGGPGFTGPPPWSSTPATGCASSPATRPVRS